MINRRRLKQTISLRDRLTAFAEEARDKASVLSAGMARDELLKKARVADTASRINDWANSPGLQPPN
jgi:hypothetical protein